MDRDLIVYKDLSNLYNLNFNGKFVFGQITGNNINKKMRKFKIEKKP